MARLTRKKQKIFAVNSSDMAGDGTSIYGTPSSGTVQYSKDVEVIQSEQWERGQKQALIGAGIPSMEDHNSLFYVATRQLKYIYQEGIPEYLATETYYKGSICKTITIDGDKVASQLWFSKIDNNINHSPTEDTENEYWTEFKGSGGGGSYSGGLFDIVTKDHEVIDDNLKLLGSTINKTNYEKFYNICKEEYEAITNQKLYTFHYIDYADRGTPSNISNYGYNDLSTLGNTKCTFSNGAYFQFMDDLEIPANTNWEVNIKLKFTAEYTDAQCLCSFGSSKYSVFLQIYSTRKLRINLSSNGSSWNIANNTTSTNQLEINTDQYIKLIYNGSNYRVLVSSTGEFSGEEIEFIKVEISTTIYNNQADDSKNVWNNLPRNLYVSSPYLEFDMLYYNIKVGDNFVYSNEDWYLVKNSNGHIYYDATKQDLVDMVDEEYNKNGVAWYYGIDTTNETVKLPRNNYLAVEGRIKGNGMTLGLYDGYNNLGMENSNSNYTALTSHNRTYGQPVGTPFKSGEIGPGNYSIGITKDPTKSGVVLNPFGYVYMVVNDNNE